MARLRDDSPLPVTTDIRDEGVRETFIPYPDLSETLEEVPIYLRPAVAYYVARMGFLPNCVKLYIHTPWIANPLFELNDSIMRDERNSLPESLKARLVIIISRTNDCEYCTAHNALTLSRRWDYDESDIHDIFNLEGDNEREKVAMEFVHLAALDPVGVTDEMRAKLAEHFSPQEVMEIILLLGFWTMYNTMHTVMAAPLEDPTLDQQQWITTEIGANLKA